MPDPTKVTSSSPAELSVPPMSTVDVDEKVPLVPTGPPESVMVPSASLSNESVTNEPTGSNDSHAQTA